MSTGSSESTEVSAAEEAQKWLDEFQQQQLVNELKEVKEHLAGQVRTTFLIALSRLHQLVASLRRGPCPKALATRLRRVLPESAAFAETS